VLALSLHGIELEGRKGASWKDLLHRFDFVGLLLFMGSTSCIIVGFSFASTQGCEFGYLPFLPGNPLMPQSRDRDLDTYVDRRRHWIVNFSWRPRGSYIARCAVP